MKTKTRIAFNKALRLEEPSKSKQIKKILRDALDNQERLSIRAQKFYIFGK